MARLGDTGTSVSREEIAQAREFMKQQGIHI